MSERELKLVRVLSRKQRRFVEEYVRTGDLAEATRRAGYRTDPIRTGRRLLGEQAVRDEVKFEQTLRCPIVTLDADAVLMGLAQIAFEDGHADDSRLRALESLAKHFNLYGGGRNAPDRSRLGQDIRTEAQDRARAALRERIERVMAERPQPPAHPEFDTGSAM